MEHVPSADGKTVDRRNHGLGQRTDLFLHLQHIQTGHTVVPDISPVPFHVHVASGTKSLVAHSCQHHHTDITPLAANIERVAHLRHRARRKSVAHLRAVDGDTGNAVIKFKKNILVFLQSFPFSVHILHLKNSSISPLSHDSNSVALLHRPPHR